MLAKHLKQNLNFNIMKNYEQQAIDFLKNTDTAIEIVFDKNDFHFTGDKEKRDIYKVILKRGQRKFSFDFGQSIVNSGFYAQYGKTKYLIPYDKLKESDATIKQFVRWNLQSDFGTVKNDKIIRPIAPTAYAVLACLQKYEVGTFENFCSEFGYDEDSKTAEKTYKAVVKEYDNVCKIWTDEEIELLQEIN